MNEEVKAKLDDFHKYNEEARKHFGVHQVILGEPLKVNTERDLLLYSKWRTKADIALNEYHSLLVELNPGKLPYSIEQLEREHKEFKDKLAITEDWLSQHSE